MAKLLVSIRVQGDNTEPVAVNATVETPGDGKMSALLPLGLLGGIVALGLVMAGGQKGAR